MQQMAVHMSIQGHTREAIGAVVEVTPAVEVEDAHLRARHYLGTALHQRHR